MDQSWRNVLTWFLECLIGENWIFTSSPESSIALGVNECDVAFTKCGSDFTFDLQWFSLDNISYYTQRTSYV